MAERVLSIIVRGTDKASPAMDGVEGAIAGLATGVVGAGLAIVAGLGAATLTLGNLTMAASDVENQRVTFERLTEDIGGNVEVMEGLKEATRGMVSESSLWEASNRFLAMGITETAEETENAAEMATQLGLAMGNDATKSMENFALMMANQSIRRLDSFGISAGDVRDRVAELQAETEGLSREQAFNTAVMEFGKVAMARMGEQGETSAATTARLKASFEDLKLKIGQEFIPVMTGLFTDVLQPLIDDYGPDVIEWAGKAAEWLGKAIPDALTFLGGVWDIMQTGFEAVVEIWETALGPAFIALYETLGINTKAVGDGIKEFDALDFIMKIVKTTVDAIVTLFKIWTIGVWAAKEAVQFFKDLIDHTVTTVERITRAVERFYEWIIGIRDALGSLILPDWLVGKSPSPFEKTLAGINEGLRALPGLDEVFNPIGLQMPLGGSVPSAGGAGGGISIVNYFGKDSVRDDGDVLMIADAITRSMTIRGVQPAL